MTSLSAASPVSPTALFPRALVRLCSQAQRQLWGLRLGRVYAFGIGFSYAMLAFAGPATLGGSAKLWARTLATASWVAGVGALSLATDLAARDAEQGITTLARLRGFGSASLARARVLAGALRLATTVAVPGLMVSLALLLHHRTLQGALGALVLASFTLPYAALVGGVLAPLARACHVFLPGRGRWLLAGLVLGPWLLALGTRAPIPSIPAAFAWLLEQAARSFR